MITNSLAHIACGFVQDANTYKLLRFIAGIELAGELEAGITLVAESLPKQLRPLGTIEAEQFGTNLRATATSKVPNMVRGTVVGMTALYGSLKPVTGILQAGVWVGLVCFTIGFVSILFISESHNRELDFLEK